MQVTNMQQRFILMCCFPRISTESTQDSPDQNGDSEVSSESSESEDSTSTDREGGSTKDKDRQQAADEAILENDVEDVLNDIEDGMLALRASKRNSKRRKMR